MAEEAASDATARLQKLQRPPSHVERLLDGLVAQARLVPEGACQTRDLTSVPKDLRRIAKLAAMSGCAWACWMYRSHAWLVAGEMLIPQSRERGVPVLQVDVYGEDNPQDSGLWMIARDGKWSRCND